MVNDDPPEAQKITYTTTTTAAAATSFPRFFDLPLELRAMIYERVLNAPLTISLSHTELPTLYHTHPIMTQELYATVMLEARLYIWNREMLPPLSSLAAQRKVERYYAAGDRRRLRLHVYALDTGVRFERVREILRLLRLVWRFQMPRPKVYVVPRHLGRDLEKEFEACGKIGGMLGFAEGARRRGESLRSVFVKVIGLVGGMVVG